MYGKGEKWARPKSMFMDEGRFTCIPDKEAILLIPLELNHFVVQFEPNVKLMLLNTCISICRLCYIFVTPSHRWKYLNSYRLYTV